MTYWPAWLLIGLWVWGWIATLRETSPKPDIKWWQRIVGPVAFFFVWPWVAWRMTFDH